MPGGWLLDNLVPRATITASAATSNAMPAANLLDPQPRVRARFVGGVARVLLDFHADVDVDSVFWGSTTAGPGATCRARLSATDPTGFAGDAWDTGERPAETSAACNGNVVVFYQPPAVPSPGTPTPPPTPGFGPLTTDTTVVDASATGITADATRGGAGGIGVGNTGRPRPGRWLLAELRDEGKPLLDVGILAVGLLWRPRWGMLYGKQEGRRMLDRRERNPFTGAEFPVPALANPRRITFTMPFDADANTVAAYRAMEDRLGAVGDALFIPEVRDLPAEVNRRAIWGTPNEPGADALLERTSPTLNRRSFSLAERL